MLDSHCASGSCALTIALNRVRLISDSLSTALHSTAQHNTTLNQLPSHSYRVKHFSATTTPTATSVRDNRLSLDGVAHAPTAESNQPTGPTRADLAVKTTKPLNDKRNTEVLNVSRSGSYNGPLLLSNALQQIAFGKINFCQYAVGRHTRSLANSLIQPVAVSVAVELSHSFLWLN